MRTFCLMAACAALLAACGQTTPDSESSDAGSAPGEAGPASGAPATAAAGEFANDEERTFYALGLILGENIAGNTAVFDLSERELALVEQGMSDSLHGETYRVELEEFGPLIQPLADARNAARIEQEKAAGASLADELAGEPGAERTASGLVIVPITEGDGASPEATDTVLVHYHGTLRDGTVFDSSVERNSPVDFPLSGVIPCWTEGVSMMKVGGKATLVCPSDIAYGDGGYPPDIPGGATLLFEVELLEIIEEPDA